MIGSQALYADPVTLWQGPGMARTPVLAAAQQRGSTGATRGNVAPIRSFGANLPLETNQFFDLSRDDRNCLKSLLILRLISSKMAGSFSLNSLIARFVSAM